MKDYLKMADVFESSCNVPVFNDDEMYCGDSFIAEFNSRKSALMAAHAINSHDELVEMNRELLDALNEVASSLSWLAHGECRAFVDGPILTSSEAINKARLAIAKAKGGAV